MSQRSARRVLPILLGADRVRRLHRPATLLLDAFLERLPIPLELQLERPPVALHVVGPAPARWSIGPRPGWYRIQSGHFRSRSVTERAARS